jgi:protocatechuate 3,4-dioxygenase beta subunit
LKEIPRTLRAALLAGPLTALLLSGCAAPASATPAATTAAPAAVASPEPRTTTAPPCAGRPTLAQTEGPFFKAGSPERTSLLEPGLPGTRVVVSGHVLTMDCKPLAGTVLDVWQADASGVYDNRGFRLRGHLTAGGDGGYSLETIVPGEYPGRAPHIHVKVQAPGRPALTTQLYFPGQARNQQDSIFNSALLMDVRDTAGGKAATFDFILTG